MSFAPIGNVRVAAEVSEICLSWITVSEYGLVYRWASIVVPMGGTTNSPLLCGGDLVSAIANFIFVPGKISHQLKTMSPPDFDVKLSMFSDLSESSVRIKI